MRIFNAILMVLMILFMAVQYNDPDGGLWIAIYAVPAVWTAVAVFQRPVLDSRIATALLLICMIASCVGIYWFWPATPEWWRSEIWWETEGAREGMGMMIVAFALAVVWFSRPANRT